MVATKSGAPFPEYGFDRLTELRRLRRLIVDCGINCVLDVGANRGRFAKDVRGIGFNGLIVSFEPLEREYIRLREGYRGDLNWRGYQFALGSKSQTAKINVVPNLTVLSSLLAFRSHGQCTESNEIEVKTLDEVFPAALCDLSNPRVLLKMDTQGYDLEVFLGASSCLQHAYALQSELSVIPLCENMPHYLTAQKVYEEAGFQLYPLAVVSRRNDGALQELNCLMRRGA